MALPVYSKADEKAMLYIGLILWPIIAASIWFCVRYNDEQVDDKLSKRGVTVDARVSDTYTKHFKNGTTYYAVLDYDYKGRHLSQSISIHSSYLTIGDTVSLRRLIDNDSPTYMKITGVRSNGVYLFRN